jgi:DnaJ-class molecular chaperone
MRTTTRKKTMATCRECNGKGSVKCPDCHGAGKRDVGGMLKADWKECKHCGGSGRKKCGVCNGKGSI